MSQRAPIELAEPGARIWLISPAWKMRALLRAQLIEEGHEVTALADWASLQELLSDEIPAPHLVIAELTGQEPPAALSLLCTMPVPRLVLRGAGGPDANLLHANGFDAVLSRPCSVDDIVRATRQLLHRPAPKDHSGK